MVLTPLIEPVSPADGAATQGAPTAVMAEDATSGKGGGNWPFFDD
ncbi:hypothetical protein [Egibacter rhizosphaerae]|nr:hypothetical protein [Egibacter rhizosphaerae]